MTSILRPARLVAVLSALTAAAPVPADAVRPPGPLETWRPPRTLARDAGRAIPGGLRDERALAVDLPGAPQDEAAVVAALRTLLAARAGELGGLGPGALVDGYRVATPAAERLPASIYVEFVQQHEGLQVEGSRIGFVVRLLPGRSVAVQTGAVVHPDVVLPPARPLSPDALRREGARALGLRDADARPRHERQRIRFVDGRWRRVRELRFAGEPLAAVVDQDTGESWAEDRRLFVTVSGRVHGRGKAADPTVSWFDDFLLKDLRVTIPRTNTATYTNATGDFVFPNRPFDETVEAWLRGRWIRVQSIPGVDNRVDLVVRKTGSTGLNVGFNIATNGEPCVVEANTAQVNAYYHGTLIHDWLRSYVPGGLPGIDCEIRVEVNALGSIAWYLDGDHDGICDQHSHLHFGEGGLCDQDSSSHLAFQNSAYDTIIYHEYGHFADDMAGGVQDFGLSEGWGDLLATYVSGQPLIGENFGVGYNYPECSGECIRRADNHYQYDPNDSQHVRGMAWAGFGWQLRKKLGATAARQRVLYALAWNARDIPEAVRQVTIADDNDGNLANGTPHLSAICQAAAAHGLRQYVPASCGC